MHGFTTGVHVLATAMLFAAPSMAQTVQVVDGSDREAFERSVRALVADQSPAQRQMFDSVLEICREFLGDGEDAYGRFDGMTLERFRAVGERLLAAADRNKDGEVDEHELLRMRTQLAKSRRRANEASAAATLRAIAAAQQKVLHAGVIDVDGDGRGEFGYFGELSALTPVRNADGVGELRLEPPALSSKFVVRGRRFVWNGYYFQMWLPGEHGAPCAEAGQGGVDPKSMPDADAAERGFVCYAWPVERGVTGDGAFVIDQCGEVVRTDNDVQSYGGTDKVPSPLAAFTKGTKALDGSVLDEEPRNDGGRWALDPQLARPMR
ncbi:MAG: hypothetical protein KDB80_16175 [Planctomycetes bacterium]|nr:hypothetical protein [Planctomycetota bacterium]